MNDSKPRFALAALAAITAIAGCQRSERTCAPGMRYFPMLDTCLYSCGTPDRPLFENCFDVDSGAVIEGGRDHHDASTEAASDSATDMDIRASDGGSDGSDSADSSDGNAELSAPRPLFPLSLVLLSGDQPTLKWALADGTDGASIELCRDRAMTMDCQRWVATGSQSRVPAALARGPWFWRLRGRSGMREGSATSVTWSFWSSGRPSARDATFAQMPDLNGDGLADLVMFGAGSGAAVTDGGVPYGSLLVRYGRRGQEPAPASEIPLRGFHGLLGGLVADVNSDGFGDLVVTEGTSNGVDLQASRLAVLLGGSSGLRDTITWIADPDVQPLGFGIGASAIGDVNGDGYVDIAAPAPIVPENSATPGRMHILSGSSTGLRPSPVQTLLTPRFGPGATFASLFLAPRAHGDIDGDGFADLLALSHQSTSPHDELGRIFLYRGSRSGLSSMPDQTVLEPSRGSDFGWALAPLGDQDGDGALEVSCSSPFEPTRGTIYVFAGDSFGLRTPAAQRLTAMLSSDTNRIGRVLGDFNGDGRGDLAVSTTVNESLARQSSRTLAVWLGTDHGVTESSRSSAPDVRSGSTWFSDEVHGVGDLDGDHRFDLVDRRRRELCFGTSDGVLSRCIPLPALVGAESPAIVTTMF